MKNYEILTILTAFRKLKEESEQGPLLSASVAWKRRLNYHRLLEAGALINEALDEISKKYSDDEHSVEDENGRRVKPEFLDEFVKERTEVLEQETDLALKMVKPEELGDTLLYDKDMDTIEFMVKEDD